MLIFLRFLARCTSAMGFTGIQKVSKVLGVLMWHCLPSRRREAVARVREHLGVPETEAARIARASFAQNAMSFLEIALISKFRGITDPRMRDSEGRIRWQMIPPGRPVVFALAHFGSWELLASMQRDVRERPLITVVRQHKIPAMNTLIHELRGAQGMLTLEHRNASASVLDLLRREGFAGFLVDHNCRAADALFLPFLGKIAAVNRGPALLAVRAKAIVYPFFMERHDDATYTIVMGEGLDTMTLTGSVSERVRQVAEYYTRAVEEQVRKRPEQWFWMHRRWKTRPKDEMAER